MISAMVTEVIGTSLEYSVHVHTNSLKEFTYLLILAKGDYEKLFKP